MPRLCLFLSFLLLAGSLEISAQTPDTATIQGSVTDPSRAPVSRVTITIANKLSGLERTAESDAAGAYSVAGLPIAGAYTVTATKTGFAEAQLSDITLEGGATAEVNLQLSLAGSQAQITVTGIAGQVRADEPQLGDRLSAFQMEETPLLDRKITYLPLLNAANRPAINQGDVFMNEDLFTTNGAGRRQTWFEVDGSNGNDSWGRQTIFSNIPLAAVQEMDVLTNAFSAEYGGSTGSVVNIVTKSGGNDFHGEA
ncbi:MAG: TonB-dependent receptor, partial [Acidobacteriaceae bacterium]|nr:TonB-dependent receptor [Acidobacteriaceae bacterium]